MAPQYWNRTQRIIVILCFEYPQYCQPSTLSGKSPTIYFGNIYMTLWPFLWTQGKRFVPKNISQQQRQYKFLLPLLRPMSYSRRYQGATMDGYSRNSKYTETFFHHPTRNKHNELEYEMRLSKRQIKTFQPKKQAAYQPLMFQSAQNPLVHSYSHHETVQKVAGDRKKTVYPFSGKSTDPLTLTYEQYKPNTRFSRPFQATLDSAKDIQRKHYLPAQRQYSKSTKHYHTQVGLTPSKRQKIVSKPHLNNSTSMKSTLQYQAFNTGSRKNSCFDDFKYNSRK